jgi:Cft2 family RNA processing exonuclease
MTTPAKYLAEVLVATAGPVVRRRFPGQDVDVADFARVNGAALLTALGTSGELRAIARASCPDAPCGHELLAALLGDDGAVAAAAAARLASGPEVLAPSRAGGGQCAAVATAAPSRPGKDAGTGRQHSNADKQLARAKKKLELHRGRLANAEAEAREALRQRDAAISDRDEALTVIESLRTELAAARVRQAALADDVPAAARLLAASLLPVQHAAAEADPRELDRMDSADRDADEPVTAAPGLVLDAITAAGLSGSAFLAILRVLASPVTEVPAQRPAIMARRRDIAVTPLGGGTEIGGSCMLVEVADVRLLVDAGTRPRPSGSGVGPPDIDVAVAGHLDAIVITHAHNDHAGYVPALASRYESMPIYCTADTAALLPTMWGDSVKVFERSRAERAAHGDLAARPPFSQAEATAAMHRLRSLPFGRRTEVADGVTIELFPAGHILGAAGVVITAGSARVVITGDVSDLAQASVSGLVVPDSARNADLLVIESTYCRPGGKPRDQEVDRFILTVAETVKTGRVLVPAFALGRAQEVLLTLRDRLPDVPVLVDGMAKEISRIYEAQTAGASHPLLIYGDNVREVRPGSRRQQYLAMRRGVIVTTSGMLSGGPAIEWARWILPDPSSALLVSGYQDEESPGRALLDLAKGDEATFGLNGEALKVRANVAEFRLSAHAGRGGLTSIISDVAPAQTMLVHGIAPAQYEFGDHLRRHGHRTVRTERWQG